MAEEQDRSPKIKVVDRRWFTDSGEPRDERAGPSPPAAVRPGEGEAAASETPSTEEAKPATSSERPPDTNRGGAEWPGNVGFFDLVNFLAQQAVLLMSGAEGVPRDPRQARVFVDFLGILEAKTRGSLSDEEARVLSDVIFQLRTLCIQASA